MLRFWIPILTDKGINPPVWLNCKLIIPLHRILHCVSSVLLVAMCAERWFALYFPLKAKYLCTVQKAKTVTKTLLLSTFILNIHWFFTIKPLSLNYVSNSACHNGTAIKYYLFQVLFWYIPGIVIVIFSLSIVFKLFKQRKFSGQASTTSLKLSKQASIMLLTVTSTFVLLTFPLPIYASTIDKKHISLKQNMVSIGMLLTMLNHSINAVLYIISGSKYRQSIIKMFRCKNCKKKNRVGVCNISSRQDLMMRHDNRNTDTLQVPQSRLIGHI